MFGRKCEFGLLHVRRKKPSVNGRYTIVSGTLQEQGCRNVLLAPVWPVWEFSDMNLLLVLALFQLIFLWIPFVVWISPYWKSNITKFQFYLDRGRAWKAAKAFVASSPKLIFKKSYNYMRIFFLLQIHVFWSVKYTHYFNWMLPACNLINKLKIKTWPS